MCVTLLSRVGRLAIVLLERETELGGVDKGTLGHLKLSKEHLQLTKHVVIDHAIFVFLDVFRCIVLRFEQSIAEGWHHKELLQHRDHVAHVAQVANTDLIVSPAHLFVRCVTPLVGSGYTLNHRGYHSVPELCNLAWTQELKYLEKELEGSFPCLLSLSFVTVRALCLVVDKEEHFIEEVLNELLLLKQLENIVVLLLLVEEAKDVCCCHQK